MMPRDFSGSRFRLPGSLRVVRCAIALVLVMAAQGCVLVTADLDPFSREAKPLTEHVVAGEGNDKILLVDITRIISDETERGLFGNERESVVARVVAELELARADDKIKGLVVRINTPGGTVTASDVIYHRLMQFKAERQVPIVAHLMDIATSGGYYVSLAADEIVAHPTTVTGSVGVVFQSISLAELLEKIGVTNQTIKSGAMKDIGSPLRTMTPAERAVLESVIADMQSRFFGLVRQRRPQLNDADAARIADGRILAAPQALDAHLIDEIGYLDDSVGRVEQRAGLSQARLIIYRRAGESADTAFSTAAARTSATAPVNVIEMGLDRILRTPQFLYLWMPGAL